MYVNPFALGFLSAIFVGLMLLVLAALIFGRRK